MFSINIKSVLLVILILALVLPSFFVSAEDEDLEEICQSMEKIEQDCQNLSDAECRQLLEKCAGYYEAQSAEIEKDITKTEKEKDTLQNQIYILKNKVKNLDYQIYQSNLTIKDLGVQIGDTESSIKKTSLKIEDSRYQLADILRHIYEKDQLSPIEILLSEERISGFFNDLTALEILNSKNKELLEDIKSLKSSLESEKESLAGEKEDTEKMVKIQNLQKEEQEKTKKEKDYLLKLTETEYQKQLKEQQEVEKRAIEIRARIFELIGVPKAPTFGEALSIAKYVESITGIRPAFLLAVLTQESNIGKNVGQCYLKNLETGDGIYIKTGNIAPKTMSPKTNISNFLKITQKLGRNYYETPVSCCMYYKGEPYGWGGAMGPAQFIPSTWILYEDKIKEITGKTADPWNIGDAFLASGIYLKELGGNKNEFTAAMHYFSGTYWTKSEEFYGRSVIALAADYEKDIKAIEGF